MTGCGTSTTTTSNAGNTSGTAAQASAPTENAPENLRGTIEAICEHHNHEVTTTLTTKIATEQEAKEAAHKRAIIEEKTLTELTHLKIPANMEPHWQQFITNRETLIKALHTMQKTGLSNRTDAQNVRKALNETLTAAKQNDLNNCAQTE
jgi:hypothetical protein